MEKCRIWEGLKPFAVILLLVVYIAGNTGYGLFHEHERFLAHSTEEENDPCHRSIYHFEKNNACKHQSHFSKNEKCGQCHLLCHTDQIIVRSAYTLFVKAVFTIKVVLVFPHLEEIFLYHPSRAPPLT